MKGIVEERAAMLGEYIIESKATVRNFIVQRGEANTRNLQKRKTY